MLETDILVVGCGIVGLSVAKELNSRWPDLKVTLIEKESTLAFHASGRNSGVVHAGFYYTPDSLKAKFTVEGNKLLTEYCLTHNLPINRCGKIVVTKNEKELDILYELKRRGDKNGVTLEVVDEKQLKHLEPNAKTFCKALFSPSTSTINPIKVAEHIGDNLKKQKSIRILFNEKFINRESPSMIKTNNHKIKFQHMINSAGLYADKIAHQFGVGYKYTLIPFKGLYIEYSYSNLLSRHVYPVPDLNNPFLGIHFTKTVDGRVIAGPTAIPALWRENYNGLSNLKIYEFLGILFVEVKLFYSNEFNFRNLAFDEIKKYYKRYFVQQASYLVKKIDISKFGKYLSAGIRAQLIDRGEKKLVMDFVIEHEEKSTHVLNAVSPAFTCAFSFSKLIVDEIENRLN